MQPNTDAWSWYTPSTAVNRRRWVGLRRSLRDLVWMPLVLVPYVVSSCVQTTFAYGVDVISPCPIERVGEAVVVVCLVGRRSLEIVDHLWDIVRRPQAEQQVHMITQDALANSRTSSSSHFVGRNSLRNLAIWRSMRGVRFFQKNHLNPENRSVSTPSGQPTVEWARMKVSCRNQVSRFTSSGVSLKRF